MRKLGRAPKQLGSPDLAYAQILYTFREVALYLRRSEATVRRWHNERPLPMTCLGSTFVIPKSAVDIWVLAAPTTLQRSIDVHGMITRGTTPQGGSIEEFIDRLEQEEATEVPDVETPPDW